MRTSALVATVAGHGIAVVVRERVGRARRRRGGVRHRADDVVGGDRPADRDGDRLAARQVAERAGDADAHGAPGCGHVDDAHRHRVVDLGRAGGGRAVVGDRQRPLRRRAGDEGTERLS